MLKLLLDSSLSFPLFEPALSSFVTAFAIAMILMPFLIKLIHRFQLFDHPDLRKEHTRPIPTMGGIASGTGMLVSLGLWFPFSPNLFIIAFFFSVAVLMALGILDDLKNTPARYKLAVQLSVATLIACCGARISSFNGMLGIWELPLAAQYIITIVAITGITNAFNLIDGIDGLAGGVGFMSLITLGLLLTLSGASTEALIAFALGGGLLGFLYYNFNPAKIFMGDTGSLVLGFVTAVLCVRLIQHNTGSGVLLTNAPVFTLGIVAIPVFDTLRVFTLRIWEGRSPFDPDKNHIHHILTNNGWSHRFTSRIICCLHAGILVLVYVLKPLPQLASFCILTAVMLGVVFVFQKLKPPVPLATSLSLTQEIG